jgi:predicted dehydrogenase
MPDTVRWGILSTADIGVRKVIPGIQQAARCEVVAMASRDGETARSVAAGLGIARSHGSYEALLADPIRVQGSLRRDQAMGIDVLTSGILDFEDGIATFTCSMRTESDQRVDIYGTTGRISIEIPFNIPPDRPTRLFVTVGGDPPVAPATEVVEFPIADPYTAEAEHFARAVLDGGPTPVPPEDGVANLRVIEAIFAAAGS